MKKRHAPDGSVLKLFKGKLFSLNLLKPQNGTEIIFR